VVVADIPPVVAALAEPAPAPVISGPDGSSYYLLGLIAYGREEDVVRLETFAKQHGWPAERDPEGSQGDRVKLMIMFPRAKAKEVARFIERCNRGEFGQFDFERMILSVRAARLNAQ
jgi:hypothetical protein